MVIQPTWISKYHLPVPSLRYNLVKSYRIFGWCVIPISGGGMKVKQIFFDFLNGFWRAFCVYSSQAVDSRFRVNFGSWNQVDLIRTALLGTWINTCLMNIEW